MRDFLVWLSTRQKLVFCFSLSLSLDEIRIFLWLSQHESRKYRVLIHSYDELNTIRMLIIY